MPRDRKRDHLNQSVAHLLHRASQCATEVSQRELAGDLTPRQYAVLVTVAEDEGLSHARLIERTGIDPSTVSGIVRRMVKKGLLQRRRTRKDGRTYALKLTEDGRRTLCGARPVMQRVDGHILKLLPLPYRKEFLEHLAQIIECFAPSNDGDA
jgi:DNA-binding MarR family transcriptional regulator